MRSAQYNDLNVSVSRECQAALGVQDEDGYDSEDDKNRVYLCRHEYMADKEQWKDEEVPVYCLCDLPFNPDIHMVKCNGCGEWCAAC